MSLDEAIRRLFVDGSSSLQFGPDVVDRLFEQFLQYHLSVETFQLGLRVVTVHHFFKRPAAVLAAPLLAAPLSSQWDCHQIAKAGNCHHTVTSRCAELDASLKYSDWRWGDCLWRSCLWLAGSAYRGDMASHIRQLTSVRRGCQGMFAGSADEEPGLLPLPKGQQVAEDEEGVDVSGEKSGEVDALGYVAPATVQVEGSTVALADWLFDVSLLRLLRPAVLRLLFAVFRLTRVVAGVDGITAVPGVTGLSVEAIDRNQVPPAVLRRLSHDVSAGMLLEATAWKIATAKLKAMEATDMCDAIDAILRAILPDNSHSDSDSSDDSDASEPRANAVGRPATPGNAASITVLPPTTASAILQAAFQPVRAALSVLRQLVANPSDTAAQQSSDSKRAKNATAKVPKSWSAAKRRRALLQTATPVSPALEAKETVINALQHGVGWLAAKASNLPLAEALIVHSDHAIVRYLTARPREATIAALRKPTQYLPFCPQDDMVEPTLPDVAIAYRLYEQAGKSINLHDWYMVRGDGHRLGLKAWT